MNICFGSVIYPSAVVYLNEFITSLENQTYKNFRLLLINDGVDETYLRTVLSKHDIDFIIVNGKAGYSPCQLRVMMMREAKLKKTDILVLGDIDDCFSADRVYRAVKLLSDGEYLFSYNRLLTFDGKEALPPLPDRVDRVGDILEYNFLGLGNTAVLISDLPKSFIDSLSLFHGFVFDWYLFSRILIAGYKGIYDAMSSTYYRIYDGNYAGIQKPCIKNIEKEIDVKVNHYGSLVQFDGMFAELYRTYSGREIELNIEKRQYYWWNFTRRKHEIF